MLVHGTQVAKAVGPKRAKLEAAQSSLDATMKDLQEKTAILNQVQEKIANLEAQLGEAVAKKEDLARQVG